MHTENKKMVEENEEGMMQQIFAKYLPYWPLFLTSVIIAMAVGYAYMKYTTPVYEAKATIIIKDEKKGNEESQMMESLNQLSSKKIVENEIEVIQSRKLMDQVINKLDLYAPVYEKKRFRSVSAYLTSPVAVIASAPDSLNYFKKIDLQLINNNQEVVLNDTFHYPVNQMVQTRFGRLEFVANPKFNPAQPGPRATNLFFSLVNPKDVVTGMLSSLKVESASKLSSIISLTYRDDVPKRAEDILNNLIKTYRLSEIEEKDALAKNTLDFVNQQLASVGHDLDSIERKVQRYKSGTGAVDISTQGQLYLQNVSNNDQKLSEYQTQLSVLNQVQKFVANNENGGEIVPSTLGVTDAQLSQLLDKLNNSELEYEKLKKTVGENNPNLVVLRDQINKLKPSILQNIQSQKQNLTAAQQNVSQTNGNYNAILQEVPQKEKELLDISREEQNKSALYSLLLQKKEESEIAYASTIADNRVVDYAQAGDDPVSPKKPIVYLVALFSFMGFCFAGITIRENLNGKVLYRQELESRTAIPIIGEVAYEKSKTPVVIEAGKRSFIAEEFRKLRISLSFLGIDEEHKKILITSSISGEGKSFIAANLAISLSLTGKKVVLVDMDLNNPTLEKILNVRQEEGITEFLLGKKDPEEIIKHVKMHENLFFISPGRLPEHPTELIANGRVNDIIEYLDSIFDIIIIDTSPIVLVTDGYLLTGLCDATLYVVRHGYTPKMLIRRIDETNRINPIKNPAIVFNGVKMRGVFKNNYGYGYGYHYAYGKSYYGGGKKGKKSYVKS